ncbi:uncharacterized protein LOC133192473 [Saccostrea echinata]|uniref:uncharacterized protein LOC133192473 n=1 Tax=Saccostrea echinata TaxID=191078 RepID=UPI002A82549C|nr:uncharacterized protein LOC133192473 [Saccostrea echinata]
MGCNAANLVTIISQLQYELEVAKRRLQVEKSEKEQALTRLSSIAGSKLAYNNPGITDLSDKNRPQKLGEKFSELYDNEWTDAIDSLTETMEEKKAILMLRNALRYVYEKTKKASEDQYRNLQMALFQRDLRNSEAQSFIQIYRKITELQKEVSTLSISNTKQFLRDDSNFMLPYEIVMNCCELFVDKCVELCWMMHIQDPPMVLDFGSSDIVDKNMFRLFTRSGDVVDFVVWPAVLLHENGPLVQKGVVQPIKTKSKTNGKDR